MCIGQPAEGKKKTETESAEELQKEDAKPADVKDKKDGCFGQLHAPTFPSCTHEFQFDKDEEDAQHRMEEKHAHEEKKRHEEKDDSAADAMMPERIMIEESKQKVVASSGTLSASS